MRRALPPLLLALALPALAVATAGAAHAQAPLPIPGRSGTFLPLPGHAMLPPVPMPLGLGPGQQCRLAIRAAERAAGIPNQLMAAIAHVESGRREPDGSINPWPWSIDVEGEPHVYDTKAEAIAAVRAFQAQGIRSIDVGCMQVNLEQHPNAFASLEAAFDPVANANYAAQFLVQLHGETGTWPTATAWYHSTTPALGADYQRRVMAVWPQEQALQYQGGAAPANFASAYASGYASGFNSGFASNYSFVAPAGPVRAGGFLLSSHAVPAHVIPLAAGAAVRSLQSYRAMPVQVVSRPGMSALPSREPGNPG